MRADDKPLFAPRPTKDAMANKNHAQGAGIFEMVVDKLSGEVQRIYVRSSTKNLFLDVDVISTFLQWRFKPNTQSSVTLVVPFTADNDTASYPVGRSIHATNRGFPISFKEPVKPRNYGNGFPSFTVLRAIDETLDGNGLIWRQLNVLATTSCRGLSLSP